jgi:hypothetical protein
MNTKSLWKSPSGKTLANTLSAAIQRDVKKENFRFKKAGKGKFELMERM